jgi:hypothetical protein
LWEIPPPTDFAVGTLCSTHELLCDNFHHPEFAHDVWTKNGPWETVAEYHAAGQNLFYGYQSKFPVDVPVYSPDVARYTCTVSDGLATAKPVFDLLDRSTSNIIMHPNGDHVAGIIDWEYAAFIPDPEDYFLQGVTEKQLKDDYWWRLFGGVADMYHQRHRKNSSV